MKKVIMFLFLTFSTLLASDQDCSILFKRHEIDPDLKGIKGWKRVCNNDKIENYLTHKVTTNEKQDICMCLTCGVEEVREIYLVKSNTVNNPIIGGNK